ncbi:hypothetical protein [Dickeya zeae]|uniref:Uncharacterized protein n=1 Tax=Dickeya zeae TaxID=204042 RepID=A0ABX8VZ95_9GAMM|nr:hypothetical protein [Dickeya zeae]QYM92220.1 hypothetical protein FGI21_10200 [Dickeya zeae]
MNAHATKSALHRTRLRFLDHKDFSVLFFYKTQRQPVPPLGFCRRTPTENSERNFSVFQFFGSRKDRHEILTIRNKRILCGFGQFEWISECEQALSWATLFAAMMRVWSSGAVCRD